MIVRPVSVPAKIDVMFYSGWHGNQPSDADLPSFALKKSGVFRTDLSRLKTVIQCYKMPF